MSSGKSSKVGRIAGAAALLALVAGAGLAQGEGEKQARKPAPSEKELLSSWREVTAERTARRRVFVSPDGKQRRGLVSLEPRWDPRTGQPVSADLRFEGALLASDQGDLRVEAPLAAGRGPARLVLADGSAVEVGTRVRLGHASKEAPEQEFARASREAPAEVASPRRAVYGGVLDGASLALESRPGGLETSLVLSQRPAGLEPGAPGAVWFEEEITIPVGWRVEGLDASAIAGAQPGAATGVPADGFRRIDQRLLLVDGAGDLRAVIEGPRVFEAGRPKGAPGRDAAAFADVRFDEAARLLVYRTAAPAAWLADAARTFPVVFDPALTANTPATVTNDDTFTLTPRASYWNAVGISSTDDYDIAISPANSFSFPPAMDFCVVDGNKGTISVSNGTVDHFGSGTAAGTLEHATPGSLSVDINSGFPWSSANVIADFEINVGTVGSRALVVEGVTGLKWAIFAPAAGSAWDTRGIAIASAQGISEFDVGSTAQTINFNATGYWHLVVTHPVGAGGSSGSITVRWPNAASVSLARDTAQTISTSPTNFTIANNVVKPNYWNGVGLFENDWDIASPASSGLGGSTTDFIVFDGNKGAIVPLTGGVRQFSGAASAQIEHSTPPDGTTSIIPGTATTRAWNATDVFRLFEIFVATPGPFTMNVGGVTNVSCAVFAPQATPGAWISRSNAQLSFAGGAATTVSFTATGFWSIAVYRDSASAPSGSTLSFDWTGSAPVPVLSQISPTSVTAPAGALVLTARGSGFTSQSVVRVNGASRTTTFVSAATLTAQILAADTVTGTALAVTVFTPGPGGGVSSPLTLTVQAPPPNPAPALATIAPTTAVAGSAGFTLTVNGSSFVPASVVRVNGVSRSTSFVGSATLTAQIPSGDVATAGSFLVTVFTPTPGGGTTTAATFTVSSATNPAPTLTQISPDNVFAGSPAFTLVVTGANFVAGSVTRWNGVNRATTFISSTRLDVAIPDTDVAFAGGATVDVVNPTPGGGTSTARPFTTIGGGAIAPTLSSISPSQVTAGATTLRMTLTGSDFGPGAVVRMDGSNLATTLLSSTSLEATITTADLASAGTHTIVVFDTISLLASSSRIFTVTPKPGGGGGGVGGVGGGSVVGKGGGSGGGGGGGCAVSSSAAGGAAAAGAMLPWALLFAGVAIARGRRRRTAQ